MKAPLLVAQSLVAGRGRADVLRGIDLEVRPGDRLAVLGPNGAGKSTLFEALAGAIRLRGGALRLRGEDVGRWPVHRRARAGLAWVPQEPSLLPTLTVADNLRAAVDSPAARRRGLDGGRVAATVQRFGLEAVADRPAGRLSGGERRRTEVARALLLEPWVLLLDEPFAGLDPSARAALAAALDDAEPALVVTDHAADDVLRITRRALLLVDGAVAWSGASDALDVHAPPWRRYFPARRET